MDIPILEEKPVETEEIEKEKCSTAMLKALTLLRQQETYSAELMTQILEILKNFPEENFFASRM